MELLVEPHPSLLVHAFIARWHRPVGHNPALSGLLSAPLGTSELPLPDDALRSRIRGMLRHASFKPSGRSKPSSEYLWRASAAGELRSINPAVDAGNAISLHSGLPISVVDWERLCPALQLRRASQDESYVFNPAGQVIALGGVLCLYDSTGPCANAIKDAQRTKTSDATRVTLSIIWSSQELATQTAAALRLYRDLLAAAADLEDVACVPLV